MCNIGRNNVDLEAEDAGPVFSVRRVCEKYAVKYVSNEST